MSDFFFNLGLFAAKTFLLTGAIVTVLLVITQIAMARRGRMKGSLEIEKINDRLADLKQDLLSAILSRKNFKGEAKEAKKKRKQQAVADENRPRTFVLEFNGDIRASAVQNLREEITAVLGVANADDEVLLRLESPGGLVSSYGLAASQLSRLKEKKIRLTVCIDQVAASGGYMMACVADHIVAAPFAVVGSIGVVAQVPNFHRILQKNDVDYREITAGEFKRTISVFGEITESGLTKFRSQIEETHQLFKNYVAKNRAKVEIAKVATGEYWFASQALETGLVDAIGTSDDCIVARCQTHSVYSVRFVTRRKLSERISETMSAAAQSLINRLMSEAQRPL